MPEHLVRTPLGVAAVKLEREALDLGERGGFEAHWASGFDETEVVGLEAYQGVVKRYLAELYRRRHGRDPGGVTLNLASHQLLDDLTGWTKLNGRSNR